MENVLIFVRRKRNEKRYIINNLKNAKNGTETNESTMEDA